MRLPAALISTAVLVGFFSLSGVTAQAAVTPAFPARDAAIATAGDQLAAINLEIQRRSKTPMSAATIELMCDGMLRAMSTINAAHHIAPAMGQIADALNAVQGFDADMDRCQARIDFAELRHREAAARLAQAGLQDDDPLTLTLAWAQLSAGDTSAAAASAQRFAAARMHQGKLLPADAALVMLIQRHHGQPPTSALETYLAQTGDAAWPRPVLSYLAEKMSQQELLQIAASLPPGQRDLAIDDPLGTEPLVPRGRCSHRRRGGQIYVARCGVGVALMMEHFEQRPQPAGQSIGRGLIVGAQGRWTRIGIRGDRRSRSPIAGTGCRVRALRR